MTRLSPEAVSAVIKENCRKIISEKMQTIKQDTWSTAFQTEADKYIKNYAFFFTDTDTSHNQQATQPNQIHTNNLEIAKFFRQLKDKIDYYILMEQKEISTLKFNNPWEGLSTNFVTCSSPIVAALQNIRVNLTRWQKKWFLPC